MQVHAQSTTTLAESRIPYIHLGYVSACPGGGMERAMNFEFFVPGTILFLIGYLIALKLNYGRIIGGVASLLKKFGLLKILAGLMSMLLIFAVIVIYCFSSVSK